VVDEMRFHSIYQDYRYAMSTLHLEAREWAGAVNLVLAGELSPVLVNYTSLRNAYRKVKTN